eukprot:CAMPEP_0184675878 /NCGR_PEP_ID=MMETSP0308-20130426/88049_1 /TAXON_ID=38269 /ORGANISM="Gloeochaete witrockiana, Strain SAG 46.84" /LENGTH=137 /DNA_ID=CAMNT_0027123663 /DNA_START=182 /DNA_END=595 /DNA_ORIENTATION=-
MEVEKDNESVEEKPATRGSILQRHKLEHKAIRAKIEELKKGRLKLNKKNHSEKAERKEVTKEMKRLVSEMEERHRKELDEFDTRATVQESASVPIDTESSISKEASFKFNLPSHRPVPLDVQFAISPRVESDEMASE